MIRTELFFRMGFSMGFSFCPMILSFNLLKCTTIFLLQTRMLGTVWKKLYCQKSMLVTMFQLLVSPLSLVPLVLSPSRTLNDLSLNHDCSMQPGKGVHSYIDIDKQKFQTINDAVKLIKHNYFLAKVDLRHAYRSVPVHPSNYLALGLKWHFRGTQKPTYLVDTQLPFRGRSAPGIFHRLTQAVHRMMERRGFIVIVYLACLSRGNRLTL